jgi:hypothetical protein
MADGNIEQRFADIKKRFNLADLSVLDTEFELVSIEKSTNILRDIRKKIFEKLDIMAQVVEPWMQPDAGSFVSLYEYRALGDEDRKAVLKQFQDLMSLHRDCLFAELECTEQADAAIIIRATKEWPGIRSALAPIAKKVSAAWPKHLEHKDVVGYFG